MIYKDRRPLSVAAGIYRLLKYQDQRRAAVEKGLEEQQEADKGSKGLNENGFDRFS